MLWSISIDCLLITTNAYAQRKTEIKISGADPNYQSVSLTNIPNCNFFNSGLALAFSDDFNTTSLDQSKWNPNYPWGMANSDSSDAWCDANEISFTGYSIKLGCNKKGNSNISLNGQSVTRDYSVGVISSQQKFNYGYYEIRCKIPRIAELWPAFWLFGECDQELDIFEFIGSKSLASKPKTFHDPLWACSPFKPKWYIPQECATANPIMTLHTPKNTMSPCLNSIGERRVIGRTMEYSSWNVKTTFANLKKGCIYDDIEVDVDFHNDWHTFAISFTPDAITWYIDGEAQFTEYRYFMMRQVSIPVKENKEIYIPVCLAEYCSGGLSEQLYEQVNFPRGDIDMNIIINNNHKSLPDYNLTRWIDEIPNWPDGYFEVDYFRYYSFTESDNDALSCKVNPANFNSFDVFPNPSNGQFTISTKSSFLVKNLTIINSIGMTVYANSFHSKEYIVDLDLPAGLYYVQFSCNGRTSSKKLIIAH